MQLYKKYIHNRYISLVLKMLTSSITIDSDIPKDTWKFFWNHWGTWYFWTIPLYVYQLLSVQESFSIGDFNQLYEQSMHTRFNLYILKKFRTTNYFFKLNKWIRDELLRYWLSQTVVSIYFRLREKLLRDPNVFIRNRLFFIFLKVPVAEIKMLLTPSILGMEHLWLIFLRLVWNDLFRL